MSSPTRTAPPCSPRTQPADPGWPPPGALANRPSRPAPPPARAPPAAGGRGGARVGDGPAPSVGVVASVDVAHRRALAGGEVAGAGVVRHAGGVAPRVARPRVVYASETNPKRAPRPP